MGETQTLTANAAFVATSVIASSALFGNVSTIANTISAIDSYGLPSTLSVVGNIAVGNVDNVIIPGGTAGQVLSTDGSGILSWVTPTASPSAIPTTTLNGSQSITITSSQVGQMFVATGSDVITLPNTSSISPGWYCYIAISAPGANIQIPNGSVYESGTNASGPGTHVVYWNGLLNKSIYTLTLIDNSSWVARYF